MDQMQTSVRFAFGHYMIRLLSDT